MNSKLLSFIVPCYNGAKYLINITEALLSINDLLTEVIIVNDGSTDSSSEILDTLQKRFNNLIVIHQENQGASAARNKGINQAKGKYICFVDVDDFVLIDGFNTVLQQINDDDLYLFNVLKQTNGERYPYITQSNEFNSKKNLLANGQFFNAPWGKIIKKELLISNHITFNTTLKIVEDLPWSIELLEIAKTITPLNSDCYIYVTDNNSSTTNSINEKKFDALWKAVEYSTQMCFKNNYKVGLALCGYQYMMNCAYTYLVYSKYESLIKRYRYLLRYNSYKKVKMVNIVANLFGIKLTACILNKVLMRGSA